MRKFKKFLRLLALILLLFLAAFGAGIFPNFNRERFQDNQIKIELVEKKDDESDSESMEQQEVQ